MNSRKIIGNIVAIGIVFIGIMLVGGIRASMGTKNIGVVQAIIMYSPLIASFFLARFVVKKIQGTGQERRKIDDENTQTKEKPATNDKPSDPAFKGKMDTENVENLKKEQVVRLGNFSVEIPEGDNLTNGYVNISHNTKYSIKLSNSGYLLCDAEVEVDGNQVGVWRVPPMESITLERPVHDTGHFTFYRFDTPEAEKAGLVQNDKLGLISVLFKPEKPAELSDTKYSLNLGGTGLSGKSEQRFRNVAPLKYDEAGFVQIHLRLMCEIDEPRPLKPISSPVPPPLS